MSKFWKYQRFLVAVFVAHNTNLFFSLSHLKVICSAICSNNFIWKCHKFSVQSGRCYFFVVDFGMVIFPFPNQEYSIYGCRMNTFCSHPDNLIENAFNLASHSVHLLFDAHETRNLFRALKHVTRWRSWKKNLTKTYSCWMNSLFHEDISAPNMHCAVNFISQNFSSFKENTLPFHNKMLKATWTRVYHTKSSIN